MTIGNRISDRRKAKGYTQEYVAEKLGISRQAVSRWEQDITTPDTKNLIALAELLDTSVEFIATGKKTGPVDERQNVDDGEKRAALHNRYVTNAAITLFVGLAMIPIFPLIGLFVLVAAVVFFVLAINLENQDDI